MVCEVLFRPKWLPLLLACVRMGGPAVPAPNGTAETIVWSCPMAKIAICPPPQGLCHDPNHAIVLFGDKSVAPPHTPPMAVRLATRNNGKCGHNEPTTKPSQQPSTYLAESWHTTLTHPDFWQSWFTSGTCRMTHVFTRTRKIQTSLR